jgi:hypothetical protein
MVSARSSSRTATASAKLAAMLASIALRFARVALHEYMYNCTLDWRVEAAQRWEAKVRVPGDGWGVIELQRDVRANHREIAERTAERRGLGGGGRPAGASQVGSGGKGGVWAGEVTPYAGAEGAGRPQVYPPLDNLLNYFRNQILFRAYSYCALR